MNEFILLIKNQGNPIVNLSPEEQQQHIQKVGAFIGSLFEQGKMKAALPLETNGIILSNTDEGFSETPINQQEELVSGYYHILATDMTEALEMAKSDPRFEDGRWKIEVCPVMKIKGISRYSQTKN